MISIAIYLIGLFLLLIFVSALFLFREDIQKKEFAPIMTCVLLWPFTLLIPAFMITYALIFKKD